MWLSAWKLNEKCIIASSFSAPPPTSGPVFMTQLFSATWGKFPKAFKKELPAQNLVKVVCVFFFVVFFTLFQIFVHSFTKQAYDQLLGFVVRGNIIHIVFL